MYHAVKIKQKQKNKKEDEDKDEDEEDNFDESLAAMLSCCAEEAKKRGMVQLQSGMKP